MMRGMLKFYFAMVKTILSLILLIIKSTIVVEGDWTREKEENSGRDGNSSSVVRSFVVLTDSAR